MAQTKSPALPPVPTADDLPGRIRPVSRDDNLGRLRGLKCFAEVHDRICRGFPIPDIAKWIQEDQKEYTEVGRASVIRAIYRYKDTIPPGQVVPHAVAQKTFKKAQARVARGINELDELDKLIQLQLERIEIDTQTERDIGKLLPTTGQEVRLAGDLLRAHAKLRQELGLMPKKLGTLEVNTSVEAATARYNSPAVAKVLNNAESRRKVLSIMQHMTSFLGNGEALTMLGQLGVGETAFEAPPAQVIDVPPEPAVVPAAAAPPAPADAEGELDADQRAALEEGEALLAAELAQEDEP